MDEVCKLMLEELRCRKVHEVNEGIYAPCMVFVPNCGSTSLRRILTCICACLRSFYRNGITFLSLAAAI
jgi:hypothetical protein